MPKQYPPKIDVFLVAEALRQEIGGKVTIMGAFANAQLVLPPDAKFPAGVPLSIYAVFHNGEGAFNARFRISDPSGKPIVVDDIVLGEATKLRDEPMQLMLNMGMFPFPTTGQYKIEIFLDDHVYEESMSVAVSKKPIT